MLMSAFFGEFLHYLFFFGFSFFLLMSGHDDLASLYAELSTRLCIPPLFLMPDSIPKVYGVSSTLIVNGLKLFCEGFVRFLHMTQEGEIEAYVESKQSMKKYITALDLSAPSPTSRCTCTHKFSLSSNKLLMFAPIFLFPSVFDCFFCIPSQETPCCHILALGWALYAIQKHLLDYPQRIGCVSFNPNHTRMHFQKHEMFAEMLPIVPWISVIGMLCNNFSNLDITSKKRKLSLVKTQEVKQLKVAKKK